MFFIYLAFILILLFFLAIIIVPIILIIYGLIKKKKKLVIGTVTVSLLIVFIYVGYNFLFPTKFPYGEPDTVGDNSISYYIGKDTGVLGTGLMDSTNQYFYRISFDENGVAYEVEEFTWL